jgi:hypothetical protein
MACHRDGPNSRGPSQPAPPRDTPPHPSTPTTTPPPSARTRACASSSTPWRCTCCATAASSSRCELHARRPPRPCARRPPPAARRPPPAARRPPPPAAPAARRAGGQCDAVARLTSRDTGPPRPPRSPPSATLLRLPNPITPPAQPPPPQTPGRHGRAPGRPRIWVPLRHQQRGARLLPLAGVQPGGWVAGGGGARGRGQGAGGSGQGVQEGLRDGLGGAEHVYRWRVYSLAGGWRAGHKTGHAPPAGSACLWESLALRFRPRPAPRRPARLAAQRAPPPSAPRRPARPAVALSPSRNP